MRKSIFAFLIPLTAAFALAFTTTIQTHAVAKDGRINEVNYIGGLAIYCTEATGRVTSTPELGFLLRFYSPEGDEVLRLNGDDLMNWVDRANAGELEDHVLVGESVIPATGQPFTLHVLTDGRFQVTGINEFGKPFVFRWTQCRPVSAPPAVVEFVPEPVVFVAAPIPPPPPPLPPFLPPEGGGILPPEGGGCVGLLC